MARTMARKRGAGEAGASGTGGRAQARRAEAAVAPGPGGPDGENEVEPEQCLSIPNECFEEVAKLLEHDTLFRCAEVGPCMRFLSSSTQAVFSLSLKNHSTYS